MWYIRDVMQTQAHQSRNQHSHEVFQDVAMCGVDQFDSRGHSHYKDGVHQWIWSTFNMSVTRTWHTHSCTTPRMSRVHTGTLSFGQWLPYGMSRCCDPTTNSAHGVIGSFVHALIRETPAMNNCLHRKKKHLMLWLDIWYFSSFIVHYKTLFLLNDVIGNQHPVRRQWQNAATKKT